MPRPAQDVKPRHTINLRLDLETYQKIKSYAESRERSVSFIINSILAKAVEKLPE